MLLYVLLGVWTTTTFINLLPENPGPLVIIFKESRSIAMLKHALSRFG